MNFESMPFNLTALRSPAYARGARRLLMICAGGLLLGSVPTKSWAADVFVEPVTPTDIPVSETSVSETSVIEQRQPRLQDLIESIPSRPIAVPVDSTAVPVEPAAEVIDQEAVDQAVRLRLSLSDRKVYVYRGETLETSYPVAIGRAGWETPTGDFEVVSQVNSPGWTNPFTGEVMPPGPDNPLGDRWIGFWTDGTNVIGFHGTPNRKSVGRAASHGCVRMYNEHIRELYDIVALGTVVTVEP